MKIAKLHDPISPRVWKTINADLDGFEAEIKGAEGGDGLRGQSTNSLCRGLERRTMPKSEGQAGNSPFQIQARRCITYQGDFQYAQHNVGPCGRSNRSI